MADKGKGALLLMADEEPEESEDMDLKEDAMKTLMAAFKKGDAAAAAKAFKTAYDACASDGEYEE